jgi:hypothetical protein
LNLNEKVKAKEGQVWPYVLPFPIDDNQRRKIWAIVQSRVGMSILNRLRLNARTYQRELIKQTPYSNKSIIEYLKRMTSADILNCGKAIAKTDKKRVWVKWYFPTKLGRWLILFLKNPNEIPPRLAKKTIQELFELYSASIVEVCERYGLSLDFFHRILNRQKRAIMDQT